MDIKRINDIKAAAKTNLIKQKMLLAALVLAGFFLIVIATYSYGIGLSSDSVGYIGAARNIISGNGVASYDGSVLIVQPPLYPVLLVIVNAVFRIDALTAAPLINASIYGLLVYLTAWYIFRYLKLSPLLAFMGTAFVLVSFAIVEVSLMAWSEPLFACFVLLYLINLRIYIEEGEARSIALLATSVALACLTRYIGAILIPAGAISILLFGCTNFRKRLLHISLFIPISIIPLGYWAIRNYLASGTVFGSRTSSIFTLSQNLSYTGETFLNWYFPKAVTGNNIIIIFLFFVISFAAGAALWANRSVLKSMLAEVGPVLLLVVTYTAFLVWSASATGIEKIGNRLLSPVAIPILLLLLYLVGRASVSLGKRFSRTPVEVSLAVVIIVFAIYPASMTFSLMDKHMNEGGWGYNGKYWKDSTTVQYLIEHPELESKCTIYTNGPDVVYILSGLHTKMTPLKSNENSPEIINELSQLRNNWPPEENACLVWFDKLEADYFYTVEDLRTTADIEQLISLSDGGVYTLSKIENE